MSNIYSHSTHGNHENICFWSGIFGFYLKTNLLVIQFGMDHLHMSVYLQNGLDLIEKKKRFLCLLVSLYQNRPMCAKLEDWMF